MVKKLIKSILGYPREPSKVGKSNEATRIEWLQATLKKIPDNGRILDAGAGEQPFKKFCAHLNYVSQDFAQYKPEEVNSGLHLATWDYGKLDIVSDIANIPEPDNSFDAIMCTEVFEHIMNPREAMKEFARLLKKDGYLILTSPFSSLTHFAPYHFYTGFNKYFYEAVLAENGFNVIEITPNGNYFEYMAQETDRLISVGQKYTDVQNYSTAERYHLMKVMQLLGRLSDDDRGSSELLCFGYHVFAQKK